METTKKILKINANGELVEFNQRLNRWELTSRSWEWSDIDPKYFEESRENWKKYQDTAK